MSEPIHIPWGEMSDRKIAELLRSHGYSVTRADVQGYRRVMGIAPWRKRRVTPEEVQRMREMRAEGQLLKVIAGEIGVTLETVSRLTSMRSAGKVNDSETATE